MLNLIDYLQSSSLCKELRLLPFNPRNTVLANSLQAFIVSTTSSFCFVFMTYAFSFSLKKTPKAM